MKLQDINFGTDECIYDYKRCFQAKGKVYEYLDGLGIFREILSNDDYDYVEDDRMVTYLYRTYITELEMLLKVEKSLVRKLDEHIHNLEGSIVQIINAR